MLAVLFMLFVTPSPTLAAEPVPETTGAFVKFCPSERQTAEFIQCAGRVGLVDATRDCGIPQTMAMADAVPPVLQWLRQHPETHILTTDAGIRRALDGLWPCKR